MSVVYKIFHLSKRPVIFRVENNKELVLLGFSKWDSEEKRCILKLLYFVYDIDNKKALNLKSMTEEDCVEIDSFNSRSSKFLSGNFNDFDSQKYIRSRNRELLRKLYANEENVLEILEEKKDDHKIELDNQSNFLTSAEIAKMFDESV